MGNNKSLSFDVVQNNVQQHLQEVLLINSLWFLGGWWGKAAPDTERDLSPRPCI
jgi:hypothetical protein